MIPKFVENWNFLTEINTVSDLEINLNKILKPSRTSLQIQSDLTFERQSNKKVKDFADKIENLVSELSSLRLSKVTDPNLR